MLDIQKFLWKPQIEVSEQDNVTTFRFWPLPTWLGNSIWNMIRRTLLSYTPGISITAINIEWISHEYTTLDWLKETWFQIMLNFKDLRFYWDLSDNLEWINQKIKWVGKYTVKDLKLHAWVEILTKDKYIFEITDPKLTLNISYRLEKWYRYLSIDELKKREKQLSEEWVSIWNLLIDNDFSLIKKVTYDIEEQILDLWWDSNDMLNIHIETISPDISAKDLLSFAWEVVSSYTKLFVFEDAYIDTSLLSDYDELESEVEWDIEEVKKTPIDSLSWLSERTRNALIKNEIEFIEELERKTRTELNSLKWVWKKAVDEIQEALEREWKSLWTK